jgi:hypothetical protein
MSGTGEHHLKWSSALVTILYLSSITLFFFFLL